MICPHCNTDEHITISCANCGKTFKKGINWYTVALVASLLLIISCLVANASEWSDEEIVNAIYKAEGCQKHCDYAYGIRSVSYESEREARRICFNTVKNNRKRFAEYGREDFETYLEFLASRYAPINAENDPKELNKNWLSNVNYFLKKGRS